MSRQIPMFFKFTHTNGLAAWAENRFQWKLPQDDEPGEWMQHYGELRMCMSGFHLVPFTAVTQWNHSEMYEAEVGEKASIYYFNNPIFIDKVVTNYCRLTHKVEEWNATTVGNILMDCLTTVDYLLRSVYEYDDDQDYIDLGVRYIKQIAEELPDVPATGVVHNPLFDLVSGAQHRIPLEIRRMFTTSEFIPWYNTVTLFIGNSVDLAYSSGRGHIADRLNRIVLKHLGYKVTVGKYNKAYGMLMEQMENGYGRN